jgi:opacity protein-like surface antigen
MDRSRGIAAAVIVTTLACLPSATEAAERPSGWYAGTNVGQTRISVDNQLIVGDRDLSDTGLSVHGGHRFGRHFAVEGSFADLGDFQYTADTCRAEVCVPELALTQFQHSATRIDLSVLGAVPLGEWLEAYGRVGVASTNLETVTRTLVGASSSEGSDLSAVYGIGLRTSFGSPWSLRLQWDRSSYSEAAELDVSSLWLGAEYEFGGQAL